MRPKTIAALLVSFAILAQTTEVLAGRGRAYKNLDTSFCHISKIKFDDGDSFSCAGEPIRILGIDTPEIIHPSHGIFEDQKGGRKAAAETKRILTQAERIIIVRAGKDPYGRTLAHVLADGELLGVRLLKMGLAYENITQFGDNGLPQFALMIVEAAKVAPKPDFEEPYKWRKRNQLKKR